MMYCKAEFFYVAKIFIFFFDIHEASIKWEITTTPVIIGKEARLICNGQNCPPGNTKKWLGGKNYDLLCFDNQSKNISKYEMKSNGTDFELMIKTLSFSDLNCEYTCACGFQQYTNMLKFDKEVIYPPVLHDHSRAHLQEDGKFQINVTMEVFPLPTCRIVLKDSVLPLNISVVNRPEGELDLFEVVVQATIGTDMVLCGVNLTLDCKVGSIQYHHLLRRPYSCKKDDREHSNPQYFIMAGIVLALVFVIVVLMKCRLGKHNVTNQRDVGSASYTVVNANKC
ncbi:uncharacterized protein LOC127711350 [Mytilus californianus]|uniref:uncharacterized protein LOC127711350 n=1 Tax=Mytilus californianus TaxID=6549 RepID=UPI002246FFAA|nr:uncharacterized protein LOC127711350 [Mytilus californianus]